jgi:hypothetical protein
MYDEETNPIEDETTHDPTAHVGEAALYCPTLFLTVSRVKYDEPLGLVNVNVFNPDRFSPKDPVPYNCAAV